MHALMSRLFPVMLNCVMQICMHLSGYKWNVIFTLKKWRNARHKAGVQFRRLTGRRRSSKGADGEFVRTEVTVVKLVKGIIYAENRRESGL